MDAVVEWNSIYNIYTAIQRFLNILYEHSWLNFHSFIFIKLFIPAGTMVDPGNTEAGITSSLKNGPHRETETVLDHADSLHH